MSKTIIIALVLLLGIVSGEIIPLNTLTSTLTNSLSSTSGPLNLLGGLNLNLNLGVSSTNDNPCGLSNYCGQAKTFGSLSELKGFTDKNCPGILYYPLLKTGSTQTQSAPNFSGTNNQQPNADESDIMKTDGEYIYSVSGNVLSIIKAYPALSAKTTSTLVFNTAPQSIYLDGKYLAVFGTDYDPVVDPLAGMNIEVIKNPQPYANQPYTWVKVYDLTNKSNPLVIKNYKFEGYYFDGRKSETTGFVYLMSSINCYGRDTLVPWYDFGLGKRVMTLPQMFYYPSEDYQGGNFVNIFAFNLRNPFGNEENIATLISANTYITTMTEQYIYLSTTQWTASSQITRIRKVYISKSKIIPIADGQVNGYLNNEFSLDENNGILRVAATEVSSTGAYSNSVYCLDQNLTTIGTLKNIAPTNTMYAARFADLRLYIVTYDKINPFYVIDLTNPKSPQYLGQLQLPGFSNFIQPYDSNTVIAFGQTLDADGIIMGTKVSLFDVSNVNLPKSLSDFVLAPEYDYSVAKWEHKAFLFAKEKNLMVLPCSFYDWQTPENIVNAYNGALIFYIKRDTNGASIQLKAIVNHFLTTNDKFWEKDLQRTLYIQDALYTKSNGMLRANGLTLFNPLFNLNLNSATDPLTPITNYQPVYNPPLPPQCPGPVPFV